MVLLRNMLDELAAEHAPPNCRFFSTPSSNRAPTTKDLSRWLRHALNLLGLTPPPGVRYFFYTCRACGATALYLCGLPVLAVAACLATEGTTRARLWLST